MAMVFLIAADTTMTASSSAAWASPRRAARCAPGARRRGRLGRGHPRGRRRTSTARRAERQASSATAIRAARRATLRADAHRDDRLAGATMTTAWRSRRSRRDVEAPDGAQSRRRSGPGPTAADPEHPLLVAAAMPPASTRSARRRGSTALQREAPAADAERARVNSRRAARPQDVGEPEGRAATSKSTGSCRPRRGGRPRRRAAAAVPGPVRGVAFLIQASADIRGSGRLGHGASSARRGT